MNKKVLVIIALTAVLFACTSCALIFNTLLGLINDVDIEMVLVEGGTFNNDTANVTLSSFFIGKYEVTQEEYTAVMGSNPSYFSASPASGETQTKRPVEQVSWYDALVFCNKLSISEGLTPCYTISGSTNPSSWGTVPTSSDSTWNAAVLNMSANGYRLPTEVEWHFAARGGNSSNGYTYSGSNTIDNVAWYSSNSSSKTHQVGLKTANELGLYDMSGNVWEWCWDWYGTYSSSAQTNPTGAASGSYRILRGGSWDFLAGYCSVSYRSYGNPCDRRDINGFRVVRSYTSSLAVPSVPINLSVSSSTTSSITLSWSAVSGATGYKVYSSTTAAGTYSLAGTITDSSTTSYTDTGLTAGTTYYYKVTAVNSAGESDKSGYCAGTTQTSSGTNPVDIEMVLVQGGTFNNGTADVTLSSFYIGKYEVTQEEYIAVMGSNPSYFSASPATGEVQTKRPVEQVSWYDALVFCNKLSIAEGLTPCYTISGTTNPSSWSTVPTSTNSTWDAAICNMNANGFRLPTEAEWQFAARGGNSSNGYTYSGSNTIDSVAWYDGNSSSLTHQVGLKTANELGLYDMSGNVWEWCWDWYGTYSTSAQTNPTGAASGSYRIQRSGSWDYDAVNCTVSNCSYYYPCKWRYDIGFRIVTSLVLSYDPFIADLTKLTAYSAADSGIVKEFDTTDSSAYSIAFEILLADLAIPEGYNCVEIVGACYDSTGTDLNITANWGLRINATVSNNTTDWYAHTGKVNESNMGVSDRTLSWTDRANNVLIMQRKDVSIAKMIVTAIIFTRVE